MAPVLSGVWWGPEAGIIGSAAGAVDGVASWLGSGQLVLVGTLSVLTALLLLSLLLLLCASCQGQKKPATGHPVTDHENLMNGVSERETFSQSVDTPGSDVAISTSHNGPLTSGTVLTDTQDTSPQLSEELLSSQSELRSSKCHQDRELPSIPPNRAIMGDEAPASGDGTYEMVKEMAVTSRDVSLEDSLYETVKELKDHPAELGLLPNRTTHLSSADAAKMTTPAPALLNGHLSPCTPERGPLCATVEYASVDLNKKSRHSADMEAKRRSVNASATARSQPEQLEEDLPPPVPEKVLDENDNQPVLVNGLAGAGLHNGECHSPPSPPPGLDHHILSDNESAVYSTVNKPNGNDEDKEDDYSSIAEIKGLVPASSSNDLYATVRDLYPHPESPQAEGRGRGAESHDPGYESIRAPKTGSVNEGHRAEEAGAVKADPDYESVAELGLNRETSRL